MKVSLSGDSTTGLKTFSPNMATSSTSQPIRRRQAVGTGNVYCRPRPRHQAGCYININCGYGRPCHPICRRPVLKPNSQAQFEKLSADELIYLMENAPNPELMGAALKKFFKRAKKKAKAVVAKVKKKYKALPKWAKIATGAAILPLAPTLATTAAASAVPAATAALTAKGVKAGVKKVKTLTPAQRRKLAAGVGAFLLPGTATAAATTFGAIKAAQATGKLAKRGISAIQARRAAAADTGETDDETTSIAVPSSVKEQIENGEGAAVAAPADAAAEKKSGLGSILPIAALAALPFIL